MSFAGKVTLVTGGASGIGLAIAEAFAAQEATVILADINEEQGAQAAASLQERGYQAHFLSANVADAAAVEGLVKQIVDTHGSLDIAVNNAGIEGAPVRTADVEEDDFDRIMAVNVKGVWLCMKYEIQQMVAQGSGVIVNMASVAGLVGAHSMPVYAASKHAVVGLTKSAAVEYARKGLRINAVCPAIVRTPMVERAVEALPELGKRLTMANPTRRLGEPDEVADAVLYRCGAGASFVNGATLAVDGGLVAQ
jgi:NAD(P)-dependent dehydrogenase (short-subunit alcohol dehydrogenase family)